MEKLKSLPVSTRSFMVLMALLVLWFLVQTTGMLTNWLGWWYVNSLYDDYPIDWDAVERWSKTICYIAYPLLLMAQLLLTVAYLKIAFELKRNNRLLLALVLLVVLLISWLGYCRTFSYGILSFASAYGAQWDFAYWYELMETANWFIVIPSILVMWAAGVAIAIMCKGRLRVTGILFFVLGGVLLVEFLLNKLVLPHVYSNGWEVAWRLFNIAFALFHYLVLAVALGIGLTRRTD